MPRPSCSRNTTPVVRRWYPPVMRVKYQNTAGSYSGPPSRQSGELAWRTIHTFVHRHRYWYRSHFATRHFGTTPLRHHHHFAGHVTVQGRHYRVVVHEARHSAALPYARPPCRHHATTPAPSRLPPIMLPAFTGCPPTRAAGEGHGGTSVGSVRQRTRRVPVVIFTNWLGTA